MRHRKKSIVVEAFQLNERGAGDYIIRGVNGEIYSCKAAIFEKTYQNVGGYSVHSVLGGRL